MDRSHYKKSDIIVFAILIPFINLFNYYLTYNNITFSLRTFLTFTIDTLEGFVAWAVIHVIILYLDKKIPYAGNVLKRIIIQLISTVAAAILSVIVLTFTINYFASDNPLPAGFFLYDIFIISVWFVVINGIYIAIYFYREWQWAENKRQEDNKIKASGFRVKTGKQDLLLSFEEIEGFWVQDEYVSCCTISGKKYVLDQSIDKLEKILPLSFFFRLNRQFMVHRNSVAGFERSENGKLNILLKPSQFLPPVINVSRTKAADFKEWFQ
ncbi:MAG: LytTR family transcriptional regulator [Cyclobacteriaceae bacterium]|nr:LytTR family transcriptional regulator [Cyclobacteriaceae bacterium]